jgi:hypothetical protein
MRMHKLWLAPLVLAACTSETTSTTAAGQTDVATSGDMSAGVDVGADEDGTEAPDGAGPEGPDAAGNDGPDAAVADGTDGTPAIPTFHKDVEPILQRSCASCHAPGSIGPFSFGTYAEAAPLAAIIANSTGSRKMPPWGLQSTPECTPRFGIRDDNTLTDAEIATIAAWASNGAPEGDPADAPKGGTAPSLGLPRVDVSLQPNAPYVTQGKQDELICFPLDPKFEADVWLQGVAVVPGNALVAHHALVFTDPKGQAPALAGDKGYYPCFASAGVDGESLIGVWAPGALPTKVPDNAGTKIAAGTQFVLQMHYHPLGDPQADTTKLELMLTKGGKPEWEALTVLIGNYDSLESNGDGLLPSENDPASAVAFKIPAGAKGHSEKMRFTSPIVVGDALNAEHRLYAAGPHMHYLGTHMSARIERRPDDAPFCGINDVTPLITCIQTNCSADGVDVEACVGEKCGGEYDAVPPLCRDCVTANAVIQGDVTAGFTTCLAAPTWTTPAQPDSECMFDAPHYDFQWQRLYQYDAAIEELPVVRPGDVLSFQCTFDNSLDNPYVVSALQYMGLDAPIDVSLGETTLDEMCLLVIQTLYKQPAAPQ